MQYYIPQYFWGHNQPWIVVPNPHCWSINISALVAPLVTAKGISVPAHATASALLDVCKLKIWRGIFGGSIAEPPCHHEQAEWGWCGSEVALVGLVWTYR